MRIEPPPCTKIIATPPVACILLSFRRAGNAKSAQGISADRHSSPARMSAACSVAKGKGTQRFPFRGRHTLELVNGEKPKAQSRRRRPSFGEARTMLSELYRQRPPTGYGYGESARVSHLERRGVGILPAVKTDGALSPSSEYCIYTTRAQSALGLTLTTSAIGGADGACGAPPARAGGVESLVSHPNKTDVAAPNARRPTL